MSKDFIQSVGKRKCGNRKHAEKDFEVPYELIGLSAQGGHFHLWVPVGTSRMEIKKIASRLNDMRDVYTYSWEFEK